MIWFVLYALYVFIQCYIALRIDRYMFGDTKESPVVVYVLIAPVITCVLALMAFDAFVEWCIDVDFTVEK